MKQVGSTDMNIATRQRHIMMIMSQFKNEGKQVTQKQIQEALQRQTGIKVDVNTISRDLREINTENTFVRDIAAVYYSRMNQQSIQNYLYAQQEALKQYNKKENDNRPYSKVQFLRLFIDAEKLIQETLNGRACDVSVAMMGGEHKRLKAEYEMLKQKVEKAA